MKARTQFRAGQGFELSEEFAGKRLLGAATKAANKKLTPAQCKALDGEETVALTAQIAAEPENTELYTERGKLHYRLNEWGAALNDFNRVLQLDDSHAEARQYAQMVQEILEFRYKDIYNP